jgi:hypothetical protein
VNQALGRFGKGRDYSITRQITNITSLRCSRKAPENGAAGRPPGVKVVHRIADHQHVDRRDAEAAAGPEQGHRVGLRTRQDVAADDHLEKGKQTGTLQQRQGESFGLVGDDAERQVQALNASRPSRTPGKRSGIATVLDAVVVPEAGQRLRWRRRGIVGGGHRLPARTRLTRLGMPRPT